MGKQKPGKYPLILPTRSGYQFAKKLEARLQYKSRKKGIDFWVPTTVKCFPNSELLTEISRHIRGEDVYIIADCYSQATTIPYQLSDRDPHDRCIRNCQTYIKLDDLVITRNDEAIEQTIEAQLSVAENFSETIHTAKAVKNACTEGRVTLVIPSLPYARQDRRGGRQGLSLKHMADSIHGAGIRNVLTLDTHQKASELAFHASIKFDVLKAGDTFVGYIKRRPDVFDTAKLMVLGPDGNAYADAKKLADNLGVEANCVIKIRPPNKMGVTKRPDIVNLDFVKGRHVIIPDDMFCTSGTALGVAKDVMNNYATEVTLLGSHAIFSPPAVERFDRAYEQGIIKRVLVTDSVSHRQEILDRPWLETVSVISYFGKAINNLNRNKSISSLLKQYGNHK